MTFLRSLLVVAFALSFAGCHDWDDDDFHCHNGFCHSHDDDFHDDHHNLLGNDVPGNGSDGEVVVFLTDRPSAELRSFHVTVTRVELQSSEVGSQVLYQDFDGFRVDLLSLRGSAETRLYELLAGLTRVPAATYESIALSLVDPELTLASGEVVAADAIDISADGELEIVLDSPLPLGPEDLVYLVLDVDVLRSVFRPAEPTGRWRVRPLVVAEIYRETLEIPTPIDIDGVVTTVYEYEDVVELELSAHRGRFEVGAGDVTITRDETRRSIDFGQILVGDVASVRGRLVGEGWLEAESVLLGDASSSRHPPRRKLTGAVAPTRQISGTVIAVDAAAGHVSVRGDLDTHALRVTRATRIFLVELRDGVLSQQPVAPREIEVGMRVEFEESASERAADLLVLTADPRLVHASP